MGTVNKLGMKILRSRLGELHQRYPVLLPGVFLLLGFLFDLLTLGRIDDWQTITQQGIYILLLALLISFEFIDENRMISMPPWLDRLWGYREEAIHFLFGSLLSAYSIFYFKSSSLFSSLIFLALIFGLLILNEVPRFRRLGTILRFSLFSLCLCSYFGYVVPVLWGQIGVLQFFVSILAALLVTALLFLLLVRRLGDLQKVLNHVGLPALSVQIIFLSLYLWGAIPPVPLSVQYMGIYHNVERSGEVYRLSYSRPWWKFWQHGDQTFAARPGDKLFLFARIFSPTEFKSQVYIRWEQFNEGQGWTAWDRIPIKINGGREEGFRGVAFKENYAPGTWRVSLVTEDEREISRLHFTVLNDTSADERVMAVEEM